MNKSPNHHFVLVVFVALMLLSSTALHAQTYNSYSGGYNTGYGTVYGSFGYAMATQNLYNSVQMQIRKLQARDMMIKQFGRAAVEKAEQEAKTNTAPSNPRISVPPPPVVRNHGVFRPDASVDTGKTIADALGSTPEEKALIRQVYATTLEYYQKEAKSRGWNHNIAGGLTFFTTTAMTIFHDAEEPSSEAINNYYAVVNSALDDIPEFASVPNKDKQNFNNILIGFGGLLIAGYTEGKQNNDATTIESYRKLAGELIKMVLKTDPQNLRLENGQIVVK
jgi:hypothetical protein